MVTSICVYLMTVLKYISRVRSYEIEALYLFKHISTLFAVRPLVRIAVVCRRDFIEDIIVLRKL